MRFSALPQQPPLYPEEASDYARLTLERSESVLDDCPCFLDLRFGSDYWQSLDVYPAVDPPEGGAPVLVFAHGGGWTNGYKEWMGLMAPAFTRAGVTFVSVSYRLAPQCKWQAMLDDCLDAIAWVRANIGQYGGNADRLAVGGHSAGGHLMALAALQPDRLLERGIPPRSIVACLPLCAPLDIRYPDRVAGSGEERTHQVVLDDSSEAPEASPICHVTHEAPFMLLAYGSRDLQRIINGNVAMEAELARQAVPHQKMVLEGDHFTTALDVAEPGSPWTSRAISLMFS